MKIYNYSYEDTSSLSKYIKDNIQAPYSAILIQVFTGILDKIVVQGVIEQLQEELPTATIIGASTSGEIINGEMKDKTIAVSFSVFKHTTLESHYTKTVDFAAGVAMAKEIVREDSKALICLGESLKSDPQNFFIGFETINNKLIITGGNAADNENFQETFIIKGTVIYDEGMVLCSLNSHELIVHNQYTLNWTPLGRELTVTKAENNIVYEINDKPVLEVYKYYFGDQIEHGLPASIVNFPLLKHENGTDIARSLLVLMEDKSFLYAGHFKTGDKVRFAIGNVDEVLENAQKFSKKVSRNPSEGIFIYSCSVRKNFLQEQLNHEFGLLNKIAPTCGFFTYGEFFNTGKSNQVLNITTTILSLSETDKVNPINDITEHEFENTPLKSLTHLVNVTQSELENKIELLNKTREQLIESEKLASLGALVSGISHEINTPLGVGLAGISQIDYDVKELEKKYLEGSLSEETLKEHISIIKTLAKTISGSLNNAAKLVKSFKQISIDQHSDEIRNFNLHEYFDELIISLHSELKKKDIKVVNNIQKDLFINSYPGVYSQIFSNLMLNSLNHAFENREGNIISVSSAVKGEMLQIDYTDNGKGIAQEYANKIFDPFFTTTRGTGGSGLGLNIIYNLIQKRLNGTIQLLENEDKGVHFEIKIKNNLEEVSE